MTIARISTTFGSARRARTRDETKKWNTQTYTDPQNVPLNALLDVKIMIFCVCVAVILIPAILNAPPTDDVFVIRGRRLIFTIRSVSLPSLAGTKVSRPLGKMPSIQEAQTFYYA